MVEVSGICSHPSLNYKVESNACCCSPGFLFSMTFKTWPRYHPQWASIPTSNPIKIISHGHAQVVLGIIDSTINTADHKGRGTGVFAHVLHSLFKSVPKTREVHKSFNQTYIKALSGFSTVLVQTCDPGSWQWPMLTDGMRFERWAVLQNPTHWLF